MPVKTWKFIAFIFLAGVSCVAAEEDGTQWFKGNTHTHSLWSDGNDFPEMIVDWYKAQGYHFLGLSDHNILSRGEKWTAESTIKKRQRAVGKTAIQKYRERFPKDWIETKDIKGVPYFRLKTLEEFRPLFEEEGKFLLIEDEEISCNFKPHIVHINAVNLGEVIEPVEGANAREILRKNLQLIRAQEARLSRPILAHLNHPNFQWAVSAEDLAHVVEEQFYEVYNGHPIVNHLGQGGRPGVERIWDIANTLRIAELQAPPLFGVATDDSHTYHGGDVSPGRGWVMVRAAELSADALIGAMRAGDYYASSGVTLHEVRFDRESGELRIEIEPQQDETYTTDIIGTLEGYDSTVEVVAAPSKYPHAVRHTYSKEVGEVLASIGGTEVVYRLSGKELYVRASITSSARHPNPSFEGQRKQAWTQPVGWRGR